MSIVKSIELDSVGVFTLSKDPDNGEYNTVLAHHSILPSKNERVQIGFREKPTKMDEIFSVEFVDHRSGKLLAGLYFDDLELDEMLKGLTKLKMMITDVRSKSGT